MNYFRAILQKDERSERALELTEAVILLNAANYTVWAFRRACLDSLGKDWTEELQWVTELAADNPKNYQIWQHRRCCAERCGTGDGELLFLNSFLSDPDLDDAKNYHAWAHRQWAVKRWLLWDDDRAFIEQLLLDDVRNNSAWNQRYFVAENSTDMSLSRRKQEVEWALDKAKIAPHNESAWAFIRGMMRQDPLHAFPALTAAVEEYCKGELPLASAIELKANALAHKGAHEEAAALFRRLAQELDPIRAKYWLWKAATLQGSAQTATS